jgi:hypothetical protein
LGIKLRFFAREGHALRDWQGRNDVWNRGGSVFWYRRQEGILVIIKEGVWVSSGEWTRGAFSFKAT